MDQAIKYKDSDAFVSDATMATAGIYIVGFDDCKAKVTEEYAGIDLHCITLAYGTEEKEESAEGKKVEGAAKEGGTNRGTDEVMATEARRTKGKMALTETSQEAATPTGVPEESEAIPKA